jgi:hypothetical protein
MTGDDRRTAEALVRLLRFERERRSFICRLVHAKGTVVKQNHAPTGPRRASRPRSPTDRNAKPMQSPPPRASSLVPLNATTELPYPRRLRLPRTSNPVRR